MGNTIYCFRCEKETTKRYYNVAIKEITKDDISWTGKIGVPIYYQSFCPKCYKKIWANAIIKVAENE